MELDLQRRPRACGWARPCPATAFTATPQIAAAYPALADAARIIGGWQIQSRASIGGNLCNSSPAADSIPALIAYDVTCHLAGPQGRRTVRGGRVLHRAGQERAGARRDPDDARVSRAAQARAARPTCGSFRATKWISPWSAPASWVQLNAAGDTIEQARVALAAVAPTPLVAATSAEWLAGKPATAETFAKAGELARQARQADQRQARHGRISQAPGRRADQAHAGHRGRSGPRRSSSDIQTPVRATVSERHQSRQSQHPARNSSVAKKIHVTTTINGEPVEFLCEARQSLLEVLRDTLQPDRRQGRLQQRQLRRLHRAARRPAGQ